MDKGSISRCINVFLMINASQEKMYRNGVEVTGCAMEISEKYQDYSYSQLTEMLSLSSKQREKIMPCMTIQDIRAFKKEIPDITVPHILAFFEYFSRKIQPFTKENLFEEFKRLGSENAGYYSDNLEYDFKPGKVSLLGSNYYTFNRVLCFYLASGGKLVSEVATSQPLEVKYHDGLRDSEFVTDLLLSCKLFISAKSQDAGFAVTDFNLAGKRLAFKDAEGNSYNIQYSVSKKKEG